MPPRKRELQVEDENDGELKVAKKSKNVKSSKAKTELGKGSDADGNAYWEIGKLRRVGPSSFKGNTYINIREYYETADGEAKPGKKGISLSLEQYQNLLKIIPELNKDLRNQGIVVEDPDAAETAGFEVKDTKEKKKAPKANIEVTSDEDSE
ncbi:transcriptional Coactivator p15-domain-containing protein [Diplogelasinospora grovesii]|uniref:Transcriptional Coactivator p15-domain-containing protein n=1 Tax=Diplogelasinospora grovesii TaxID=303347 RepID=A0AAN6NCH0_9PEZI|nr:transcriptional Coactivator p15-domain-containing protein [Diplogelasinospora grovesii]